MMTQASGLSSAREDSEPTRPDRRRSRPAQVDVPEQTRPVQIAWEHLIAIVAIHLLALLAFFPWFFSWTGVMLVVIGWLTFNLLGINVGYHRLLTHQGFTCPKWLEHFFAVLGVCCLQDSPARWVAIHRLHHRHTDERPDPHTPLVSFFWAHVGWLFVKHGEHSRFWFYEQYARDILRDRFYVRFEQKAMWLWTYIFHAVLYFLLGLIVGWASSGDYFAGAQFGLSVLVWGVFVRTVVVWHNTWWVNSVTHIWGYRNYETSDDSRNQWFVALLAHGEGWHNNHHADQRSAKHGHQWWEYDLAYLVIRLLERVGLASDIAMPRVAEPARRSSTQSD